MSEDFLLRQAEAKVRWSMKKMDMIDSVKAKLVMYGAG